MADLTVSGAQPSSQSTMLTILWTLLSFTLPASGFHISVSCPQVRECQLALLSKNDVLLECSIHMAQWFFSRLDTRGDSVNLSSTVKVRQNLGSDLLIQNPTPFDTGLYECRDENNTQVTQFRIDFQDITKLHVTHKDLDQKPLMNKTLSSGHGELVYTQWEPWQGCSNCEGPGERKRLGYCYIKEPLEEPIPCGLYQGNTEAIYLRVRPEMQMEACFVECESQLTAGDYVIFNSYKFMEESESAWLTCPFASIYRPVHWEVNNTPLTWQGQLSGRDINTNMDLYSGGQQLQVFKPAIYRCFVKQELIAQFNPLEAERQQWLSRAQPGKADSVPRGLKLTLLMVSVLVVGGLLCKVVFHSACGKRNTKVLLVK